MFFNCFILWYIIFSFKSNFLIINIKFKISKLCEYYLLIIIWYKTKYFNYTEDKKLATVNNVVINDNLIKETNSSVNISPSVGLKSITAADQITPQIVSPNEIKHNDCIVKKNDSLLNSITDNNYYDIINNILENFLDCVCYILHMPAIILPITAVFIIYLYVFFLKIEPYILLATRTIDQTILLRIKKNKKKFYILCIMLFIIFILYSFI